MTTIVVTVDVSNAGQMENELTPKQLLAEKKISPDVLTSGKRLFMVFLWYIFSQITYSFTY